MIGQFVITLREGFEAALITAIIVAYLLKTHRTPFVKFVWYGVYIALALSVALGGSIWLLYGSLSKPSQLLFESLAAFIAVIVLSSMIYWMATKGRHLKSEVERRLELIVSRTAIFSLTSFSFIVVFREGLETVLFLTPFLLNAPSDTIVGGLLGIMVSLILAYSVYTIGMRVNVRIFFYYTSILLILLAGGLAGYGTHEMIEYFEAVGIKLGWLAEPAYILNIPSDSWMHHKGIIGSILAVMFGYTVKAEWLRLVVHAAYIAVSIPAIFIVYRERKRPIIRLV
ncbi:MAG: FTR1 family protein [Nitrososphaerota archaeon]